jgi:hypothetical protein
MDPSIINALIYDYISSKDKILAETTKKKLNAVSYSISSDLDENLPATCVRPHFFTKTHFDKICQKHIFLPQTLLLTL